MKELSYIVKIVPETDISKAKALFTLCFDSDPKETELFFRPAQKTIFGVYDNEILCSMLVVFDCVA